MKLTIALLITSLGAVASSSAAPPPKTNPNKDLYYPIHVGAKWVYDIMEIETTIVVTKVEKADNGKLVTTEYVAADGKRTPCHKYLVSSAGIWMTEETGEVYTPAWQMLKAPFKEGRQMEDQHEAKELGVGFELHIGKEETVSVPAGKYTAVKVTSNMMMNGANDNDYSIHWYTLGIGEVKRESINGKPILTLKSFTPGKD